MMVFGAYMLVNIWQNNQPCASRGATKPAVLPVRTRWTWRPSRPP